jgi:hypothetical protein
MMGWDGAYQKALYSCLSDTVHRLVQVVVEPLHIGPMRGSLVAKQGRSRW